MTTALLWLGGFAVAAVVTGRVADHLAVASPLRRPNYRGLEVPTSCGVALLAGLASAGAFFALLRLLVPASDRLAEAAFAGAGFVAVAFAFGFLGLWDDLAGRAEERGWRTHLRAVRTGRPTAGALKVLVGGAAALAFTAPAGGGFWWALGRAATLALAANLYNLLDLRPGRAGKAFILAAAGLCVVGGPAAPPIAAAAGAVAAFLPYDLRERAMLGDVGAYALGAVVGWGIVGTASHTYLLVALGLLVGLHVAADRPGLSRLIAAVPPLRALDAAGRVPEDAPTPSG